MRGCRFGRVAGDKEGVDLLIRFQPVASDLRRVVAAMKLSPNIERVADQATNVARRARKLNRHPALPETELIEPLYALAMSMFKDSIDAYVREDVPLAMAIIPRDEEVDEMNATLQKQLIDRMAHNPEQLRGYLNLIFIAHCMERVGDHATNIAEDAVYAAAAEDIRHLQFDVIGDLGVPAAQLLGGARPLLVEGLQLGRDGGGRGQRGQKGEQNREALHAGE